MEWQEFKSFIKELREAEKQIQLKYGVHVETHFFWQDGKKYFKMNPAAINLQTGQCMQVLTDRATGKVDHRVGVNFKVACKDLECGNLKSRVDK